MDNYVPNANKPAPTKMDGHYNTTHGAELVAARQAVYTNCLPEGIEPEDYDRKVINTARIAGISRTAVVVDVGCSSPHLLNAFREEGHTGPLIGVEPNTKQFNGLPFWQPNPEGTASFYGIKMIRVGSEDHNPSGLDLYEGGANLMPLSDMSADLILWMFNAYHIPKELQSEALNEAIRVLIQGGMFVLATSGNRNKEGFRDNEIKVADYLSNIYKRQFIPPEPLSAGFTTEDGKIILPEKFGNVYIYERVERLVYDTPKKIEVVGGSYHSLRDQYTDEEGHNPSVSIFDEALNEVVIKELLGRLASGEPPAEDIMSRSVFVASDNELFLPPGYEKIAA